MSPESPHLRLPVGDIVQQGPPEVSRVFRSRLRILLAGIPHRFGYELYLVAISITAGCVGLANTWNIGFDADEAATITALRMSPSDLFQFVTKKQDAVHWIYYQLMMPWARLFGYSEISLRLPSCIALASAVYFTGLIGRELGGRRVGVVATIIFTVLPRAHCQALLARSYTLQMTAAALASWLFIVALRSKHTGIRAWIAYAVAATFLAYSFTYAGLVLAAHLAYAIMIRRKVRCLCLSLSAAAALTAPLVFFTLSQRARGQSSWISTVPINAPTLMVEPFFVTATGLAIASSLIFLVASIAPVPTQPPTDPPSLQILTALWLVLPGAILVVTHLYLFPAYHPRYVGYSLPAFALVLAFALDRLGNRLIVALATGVFVIISIAPMVDLSLQGTATQQRVDWRAAAVFIARNKQVGDGLAPSTADVPVENQSRGLSAYREHYSGIKDLTLVARGEKSFSFLDTRRPLADSVSGGTRRIWVLRPLATPQGKAAILESERVALDRGGYRLSAVETLAFTVVELWVRG